MWKILLILSALFTAGAAYVGYENLQSLKSEKALLERAKENLEASDAFQKDADATLKKMKDDLATLTDKDDKLAEDLAAATEEKTTVEADLAKIKTAIDEKKAKVAAAEEQTKKMGGVEEAMQQVNSYNDGIALATAQVAQLKQQNESSTSALARTADRIEDYRNLELWQKTGKMENLSASVSMVSRDYNFVIINAGNDRGVVNQAKLDVTRNGSKVGEVRVSVLEPVRSVCNIESISPGQSIQPGDRVVVSEDSKPTEADTAAAVAKANAPSTPDPASTQPAKPETADPLATDPLEDPLAEDPFAAPAPAEGAPAEGTPDEGAAPAEPDPFGL